MAVLWVFIVTVFSLYKGLRCFDQVFQRPYRYANFSKLMRTIHKSMKRTFQCEYYQSFTFKRCDKFKLKCTGYGDMYSAHYFGELA